MSLIRYALEHVFRLLGVQFYFSESHGPAKLQIFDLIKQLPKEVLAQIAESAVTCSSCGYAGPLPIISKYYYCKCGCVPQGYFPRLRILQYYGAMELGGYKLGAVVLASQNVIVVDVAQQKFELVWREGVYTIQQTTIGGLEYEVRSSFFAYSWGYPEYLMFYNPGIESIEKIAYINRQPPLYIKLPATDAATYPSVLRMEYEISGKKTQLAAGSSYVQTRSDNYAFSTIGNQDDDIMRYTRVFRTTRIPVQYSINVPGTIVLLVLFLLLLYSLIHIAVSYARITSRVVIVNNLHVSNSTIVRDSQIQNAAQFLNSSAKLSQARTLVADSLRAGGFTATGLTIQSEYSAYSYNFASARPKTFTANRLTAANVMANKTRIDAEHFSTTPYTILHLTKAQFEQSAALATSAIENLQVENLTCEVNCRITGSPRNITVLNLNARRVTCNQLSGKLPTTPQLTVDSATIGKMSAQNAVVADLEVVGKMSTFSALLDASYVDVLDFSAPSLSTIQVNSRALLETLTVEQLEATGIAIDNVETQQVNGYLSVSGNVYFDAVNVEEIECGSVSFGTQSASQQAVTLQSVVITENQACNTVVANSSTLIKTYK